MAQGYYGTALKTKDLKIGAKMPKWTSERWRALGEHRQKRGLPTSAKSIRSSRRSTRFTLI
jgi:hypothetical protein